MKHENVKYIWELVLMLNVFLFINWLLMPKTPRIVRSLCLAMSFGSSFFAAVQIVLWSL